MSEIDFIVKGAERIERELEQRHVRLKRKYRSATRAGAVIFQRTLKGAVKGKLKRSVRIFPEGETTWGVRMVGPFARWYLKGTAEHEIAPRGIEGAQRRFHRSGKGRALMAGPAMVKRALSYPGAGHPFPRAVIPSHAGDPAVIEQARVEGSGPARLAVMEVLKS